MVRPTCRWNAEEARFTVLGTGWWAVPRGWFAGGCLGRRGGCVGPGGGVFGGLGWVQVVVQVGVGAVLVPL